MLEPEPRASQRTTVRPNECIPHTGAAALTPGLALAWAAVTDVGRVRESNQDAYLAAPPVFAVADGLGGHAGGEVASALAVQAFEQLSRAAVIDADTVARFAAAASAAMAADVAEHPDRSGMATTLSVLVVAGLPARPHLLVVNVGDSRVYRVRNGEMAQLTVDHSEVQELLSRGLLDRDSAARYPRRNVVTRVLGAVPDRCPDIRPLSFAAGDRYLLCTDGLHGAVSEGLLARILTSGSDVESTATALLGSALATEGYDNITAVVVEVTGEPS